MGPERIGCVDEGSASPDSRNDLPEIPVPHTRLTRLLKGGHIETLKPPAPVPGGVYLCQVDKGISCAACCGLYNVPDPSRPGLEWLLSRRSGAFAGVPREIESIDAFGRLESERMAAGGIPLPAFHHCPYIGFIGENQDRPGCLLHPLAEGNAGIDFRGLSHYGSMTCNMYFCPTHHRIPANIKVALQEAAGDWYIFGLMAAEADLLETLFDLISEYAEGRPFPFPDATNINAWHRLFSLKTDWPYARSERPLAVYFFNDDLYPKPPVDYCRTGRNGSRLDTVFRELHSVFPSAAALSDAEKKICDHVESLW